MVSSKGEVEQITISVDKHIWRRLAQLKLDGDKKSLSEVIEDLL